MEITKSEKSLKKKKIRDIFRYDVIQEKAWFKAFLTATFNKFVEQLSNSQKIRLWNLVKSIW